METKLGSRVAALAQLARDNLGELEKRKFGADKLRALEVALHTYRATYLAWLAERGKLKAHTVEVGSALNAVSRYRVELNRVLLLLGKDGTVTSPPLRGEKLAASAVHCLRWMSGVRSTIASHEAQLASCMERPLARFDDLQAKLASALGAQQQSNGGHLPALREALSTSRAQMERSSSLLVSAARLAFTDNKAQLKRLNAALALGRRPRRRGGSPPAGKDAAA